ncbi:MAG TPA: undecaprenyl-diphosphate phosphatase [Woeseiaceae bacterium]|nr:undecaprenyl-diphosphate phosphatase [Woeseiaceae bacterium]
MSWLQIVVLAIVQGITEFLPVSSSGHLVLVPAVLGWGDQGLVFDVAVHFGSLLAVCAYFRDDIAKLVQGGVTLLGGSVNTAPSRLALGIALGTVPAAVAGLALAGLIEENLRSPTVIVVTLSGFGILMVIADRYGRRDKGIAEVRVRDAFIIGCAQALALVPGTSRSGVTITAGRFLGFERRDAARFSFLLSVPVILLATAYETLKLVLGDETVAWVDLALGIAVSALVAYLTIGFFMRVVGRIGLLPFAAYRLLLAAIILYLLVW